MRRNREWGSGDPTGVGQLWKGTDTGWGQGRPGVYVCPCGRRLWLRLGSWIQLLCKPARTHLWMGSYTILASLVVRVKSVKVSEVKVSARNAGDLGLIPGSGRSPGEGNGNPLQYSCLKNPMYGEARWATVHGVTNSQTWLSNLTYLLTYLLSTYRRLDVPLALSPVTK